MSTTVTILSVADDVYYAPQIVASELGFFADEGLSVEFDPGGDPRGLARSVAEGKADFSLGGLWGPWLYLELGEPFVAFAELVHQCPLMLFGRVPPEAFAWSSLEGGSVLLTSSSAPSPWCALQALLRRKGVDLGAMHLLPGFPAVEARRLFADGRGDLLELFGRSAAPALADEELHQLVTWRTELGAIPWSVYFTTRDGLRRGEREAVALTRALYRAQQWLHERATHEIAAVVAAALPGVPERDVDLLVDAFAAQELWPATPVLEREPVERWQGFLVEAGLLSGDTPYQELVDETIAASAMAHA